MGRTSALDARSPLGFLQAAQLSVCGAPSRPDRLVEAAANRLARRPVRARLSIRSDNLHRGNHIERIGK
jgi:hypothetical protein